MTMPRWDGPTLPVRWGPGSRQAFVGRGREIEALREAWLLAAQGDRQVVFVGGEPGVGKSRLVGDMAARLHEQGAAVLLGACVPEMGTPYQPFVEPMGALISAVASGELTIDGSAGMASRRLASLRTMTGTERPESPDGPEHQFTRQLFEDCSEAVLLAARSRPLVIVLEDLQWAGDTALQLLRYLVGHTAESRILIMATLRTSAPDRSADLVSTVGRLYRLDGVRRMDLDGLTTDDIADFLAGVAVASRRDALAAAAVLRDQTGGNPFLLLEVWRELSAHGGLSALLDVDLRAPESVRETVSHRLAGLPQAHRRTVEIAAVIGEEAPVRLLSAIAERGTAAIDATALTYAGLEAATAVGLLEPARGQDATYRFPHGLARQAVLDLLTDYQRACDNARVAEVLEAEFPAADRRVQRLGYHYASAQALGYSGKAVQYLTAAGEAAERSLAHHEAARLFERAAGIADLTPARDDLRMRAARSWMRSSQFDRARQLDALVAETATGADRLRAAIGYEAASWRCGEPGGRSVELLTAAMAEVTLDELHPLNVRGTAALGRALVFSGEPERAKELGDRAVELARATGDDVLLAAALQIALQDTGSPADLKEKLARAMELTELSKRVRDPRHLGPAAYHRAAISYILGDPAGLAAARRDIATTARATGQPFWEWVQVYLLFGEAFLRADFVAAMQQIAQSQELVRSFEAARKAEGPAGLQTFMVRRETGGLDQVRALIDGSEDPGAHWTPALLALYCELELPEPTRRTLDFLLQQDLSAYRMSSSWPIVVSFLVDAACWLEDADAARLIEPMVEEYAGLNLLGGEFLAAAGSADRGRGEIASLLGRDTAEAHFVSALEMDTAMGSPVHIATTLAAHVRHLHRVCGTGTTERAAEMTERAHALCRQYGLVRAERLLDRANRSAGDRKPVDRQELPAGLTARERQVLGLLGQGMSNRRIAGQLHITENTTANHVRSILMKTGAANRTQAAMFASSHGLLS
jgi:DNA-binding CsgD family transcriptional regulator